MYPRDCELEQKVGGICLITKPIPYLKLKMTLWASFNTDLFILYYLYYLKGVPTHLINIFKVLDGGTNSINIRLNKFTNKN